MAMWKSSARSTPTEIEYELITDYAENALLRVDNTDWTIMGIPTVQKDELSKYFVPLGSWKCWTACITS